ncbi:hypothetical protein OK016_04060 [Vibrio chagasii]|nr:hypothetical protein [Vibrio chagasii]
MISTTSIKDELRLYLLDEQQQVLLRYFFNRTDNTFSDHGCRTNHRADNEDKLLAPR